MKNIIEISKRIDFEALFWLTAFAYLAFINPYAPKHLDFCLLSLVGIDTCPGCGLGKSISMIFHGDFAGSFNAHPLGIPAILLISKRIYKLIKNKIYLTKKMEVYSG
ncbi:MAG: DUF2752 domain-containing protein [Melioribacteraceae bacterium]|nr:DUF2752 domain-containing protein [Melioribacteraceae bacterium]